MRREPLYPGSYSPQAIRVGKMLRDARTAAGLGLKEAAHSVNIYKWELERAEIGGVDSLIVLECIASALGLRIDATVLPAPGTEAIPYSGRRPGALEASLIVATADSATAEKMVEVLRQMQEQAEATKGPENSA